MAQIVYTHSYDLAFKFLAFLSGAVGAWLMLLIASPILDWASAQGASKTFIDGVLVVILISSWIFSGIFFINKFGHVPNYLYIRNELGAKVSMEDAASIECYIEMAGPGKWRPLLEVKQFPKDARRDILIIMTNQNFGLDRESYFFRYQETYKTSTAKSLKILQQF